MTTRLFDGAHVATIKPLNNKIEQLVQDAKKNKRNRVYYSNKFQLDDLRILGVVQSDEKSIYDQLTLDNNESIELYGFDQDGSYFSLYLLIVSLYPNVDRLDEESRWRLAKVNLTYINAQNKSKYTYKCDQLIDYDHKRNHSHQHDTKNIWKIGSLSIETVLPFSFTRILFNGLLSRVSLEPDGVAELVSAKLTISTHPSSDKFDYQDRFDEAYLSERLTEQIRLDGGTRIISPEKLLATVLEDRIDQTMMFQGHLELFGKSSTAATTDQVNQREKFIMWGAKLKRFLDPLKELKTSEPVLRETLLVWNECGLMVHLTRPLEGQSLLYGLINNSYEYSSPINGAKYVPPPLPEEPETGSNESQQSDQQLGREHSNKKKQAVGSCLNELNSFGNLKRGSKINLRGYQRKDYTIEILETGGQLHGLIKINLNGFDGWALIGSGPAGNLGQQLRESQNNLWALNISTESKLKLLNFSNLASERLLGGKGNSLIELDRLTRNCSLIAWPSHERHASISVPRGIVVSCLAYRKWFDSDPMIRKSIAELDLTRRMLAASSVNVNPLSENYLSLAQRQQILKEHCQKTHEKLNACPLPAALKDHLRTMLLQTFTKADLGLNESGGDDDDDDDATTTIEATKLFAIRSSAVGEDSLETSVAGQMRTILDARGFETICRSIVDCWSSQFELEALTYKTQNSLPLNLPMAVVVQELISCQRAGVAATCDPLTGNKEKLEILANVGLGEGVVSGGKADTIRVSLRSLGWNESDECCSKELSIDDGEKMDSCIEKAAGTEATTCCLTDGQIVALANLLLKLRNASEIRDREIEWGITLTTERALSESGSSSSSSSSSSITGNEPAQRFHIHLFQSRPLTHLTKLGPQEIDHELDHGLSSPLEIVSRANLGEVMPGVLCPLTVSHFLALCTNLMPGKPFEEIHTCKPFTATSFAAHGNLFCMVLTNSDVLSKFSLKEKEEADEDSVLRVMIGHTPDSRLKNLKRIADINREKMNPISLITRGNLLPLLGLDLGLLTIKSKISKQSSKRTHLEDDLRSIEEMIESYSDERKSLFIEPAMHGAENNYNYTWSPETISDELRTMVRNDVLTLFDRLCKRSQPLVDGWSNHIKGTILSMVFNMICLKILNKQPAYAGNETNSSAILNDFSILIRGGPKTESGNVSHLLNQLIVALEAENKLEKAKQMDTKELYKLLTSSDTNSRSTKLFARFMKKNGHRAFKEFDYTTSTWASDPSYIIKSLAARLKQFNSNNLASSSASHQADTSVQEKHHQAQVDEILAKVTSGRAFLVSYALPRARNAIVRREKGKSQLIKAIDKFRRAFRHLGGLLCLEGRLPSAELIFQLSSEELDRVVRATTSGGADHLAGIIYKARRRLQRARVMDRAAFPRPTIDFDEMVETIQRFSEGLDGGGDEKIQGSNTNQGQQKQLVRGMTSCAGKVTGRACVVGGLDDMDQIEPNDILITYSIDISWSVYFFTLAGIVTEVGGIVSHGAVVAREYGIPTLCTAVGACSMFKTGQLVTLDANRGTCYLAAEHELDGEGQGEGEWEGEKSSANVVA